MDKAGPHFRRQGLALSIGCKVQPMNQWFKIAVLKEPIAVIKPNWCWYSGSHSGDYEGWGSLSCPPISVPLFFIFLVCWSLNSSQTPIKFFYTTWNQISEDSTSCRHRYVNIRAGLQFARGTRMLGPDVLCAMPSHPVAHVSLALQWKSLGRASFEVQRKSARRTCTSRKTGSRIEP
jgi:hypothetical protein